MVTPIQRNFAGGEIAPGLYGRADVVKYRTGLRTCRNFLIQKWGGLANRPGSKFVAELKDGAFKGRYIPFIFNADQTYALLFTRFAMRVIRQGVQLTDISASISGVSLTSPVVVTTSAAHNFAMGEEVAISGVLGTTQVNGRNFKLGAVTATTFELLDVLDGAAINGTAYTAYTSGGTAARVFTLATPYTEVDLPELRAVQSADVVTLTHPNYAPRELKRTGHVAWTSEVIDFVPDINRPRNAAGTAGAAGSSTYRYKVTASADSDSEESLAATQATTSISAITQTNPAVVTTTAAHGYQNGDGVLIENAQGMTELNGREFEVANQTATTFELKGENSIGYNPYVAAGTAGRTHIRIASAAAPTLAAPHTLSWNAVDGASEYTVYKEKDGLYGYIGIAVTLSFTDTGITPDIEDNAPTYRNPFVGPGNFPTTAAYYQQRLIYGATTNAPETVFASRTDYFHNFTKSFPTRDQSAIIFPVRGRYVNAIRHLVDLRRLIVFTASAEWIANGDDAGRLTPYAINLERNSENGSGPLPPLVIADTIFYQQARQATIRSLAFDFQADGYRGGDVTIFSPHLFEGYTLTDWTYAQVPHSTLWVVRSDGTLLGFTYIGDQQIWGWHRHDTDGSYEGVTAIPEGSEDAFYAIVKRTVNGKTRRYAERFATRRLADIRDAVFMDSALTFDGRNTNTLHTMTLSGGTNWTDDETLTLTSNLSFFVSGDVGNQIQLTGSDGTLIRFSINAFSSATVVTGRAQKTVPVVMRSTAISSWVRAVDDLTGLWHLEGESVSVMGDGFVVANPNNPSYPTLTVTNGALTLADPYGVIHVGLPYLSDMETLDLDVPEGDSLIDKSILTRQVTLMVAESRGLWAGLRVPESGTDGLTEFKLQPIDGSDSPPPLRTEAISQMVRGDYKAKGRCFIRQVDPIPAQILAVAPMMEVGR